MEDKMKVSLEKDYRKYYTLEDLDRAKEVIRCLKEDETPVSDYAGMAAREALRHIGKDCSVDRIIEAGAETSRNNRICDQYGDTGNMDVWVYGIAKYSGITGWNNGGFIEFGAYLSDIYGTCGEDTYGVNMSIKVYEWDGFYR